jgi:hypothetical protein
LFEQTTGVLGLIWFALSMAVASAPGVPSREAARRALRAIAAGIARGNARAGAHGARAALTRGGPRPATPAARRRRWPPRSPSWAASARPRGRRWARRAGRAVRIEEPQRVAVVIEVCVRG